MQKNNTIITMLVITCLFMFLANCGYKKGSTEGFCVNFFINDTIKADSAGLYVWDDVYRKNRLIQEVKIHGNHAVFTGMIDNGRIAYIKTNNENNKTIYFILTNDSIYIDCEVNAQVIKGGKLNNKYSSYLKKRQDIRRKMREISANYIEMASDSLLTLRHENEAFNRYKYWNDSLQSLYSSILDEDAILKDIFMSQYGNEIDSAVLNLDIIKNKQGK